MSSLDRATAAGSSAKRSIGKISCPSARYPVKGALEYVELGCTLTTEVKPEGSLTKALLNICSPVFIVSLKFHLEAPARKQPNAPSPKKWRDEVHVEEQLEPSAVILQNYSGERLAIIRQINNQSKECFRACGNDHTSD